MSSLCALLACLLLWQQPPADEAAPRALAAPAAQPVVQNGAQPVADVARPADGQGISLELRDADVREALRMVAKQSDIDIVLSNAVQGSVTLELEDASLAETLDAIMAVTGLLYDDQGAIITVSTLDELVTQKQLSEQFFAEPGPPPGSAPALGVELFRLEYVDAERVQSVIQPLLSEWGKVSLLKTADHVMQDNSMRNMQPGLGGAMGSMQGQGGEADVQIGGRLNSSSQGQPARSHTLVVTDTAERLERIAAVVEEVDVKPLQVQIEARFVEVILGKDDKLGIDWNVAIRAAGAATATTFPFGFTSLGESNPGAGLTSSDVLPPAPLDITTPGEPGLFTFGTLDYTTFTALLEMIDDDNRVQVVSNPRVLVQDRTTATILVGERFPILSTTITDQGTVTEELDRYEPIGVQLEVTPSVLNDDEVTLFVRPSTSTLGGFVEGSTGIQVVRINTRQVDTSVTALDGQTVVLGGLISSRQADITRRVPYLSRIPLLGNLFTYEATEIERVDLVVFLTVTIDRDGGLSADERELFEKTSFTLPDPDDEDAEPWWTELDFSPSAPRY